MTFLVFLVVVLAAILHAVWNFAAKQAAGNLGALWLGVCLGAVLSWPHRRGLALYLSVDSVYLADGASELHCGGAGVCRSHWVHSGVCGPQGTADGSQGHWHCGHDFGSGAGQGGVARVALPSQPRGVR